MRATSFLVLSCIFKCFSVVLGTCIVNKCENGFGDCVQCSNESLSSVLNQSPSITGGIMIFQSYLQTIPANTFGRYGKSLKSLNMHQCTIFDIDKDAFRGLTFLEKLSLPNNKITAVKQEWFADLISLEQLDLSYNLISRLEPTIFTKLIRLKRLNVEENRLTCIDPLMLRPMGGIDKFYFSGNPLSFRCRAKLTLWLRDHGVDYMNSLVKREKWLDSALWLCAIDDPKVAESEDLMKECVILNLFNQLNTGLTTGTVFPLPVSQQCVQARNLLTKCIATKSNIMQPTLTNGNVIKRLLLQLRESKSAT